MSRAGGVIRSLLEPSLLRRMLLVQVLLVTLLWTAILGFVIAEGRELPELFHNQALYEVAFAATESLADSPQGQEHVLQMMGNALAASFSDGDTGTSFSPIMYVRSDGRLLYKSNPDAPLLRNRQFGVVETLEADGKAWRALSRVSPGGTVVTMALPDTWGLMMTIGTRGYYLGPLVISLPFLLLPAWLSIHLALRPWRKLSHEIEVRAPSNLQPLDFQPRHRELRPLVSSINTLLQRVSEVTQRERTFIADAAHEMRTPLAALRINAEALRQPRDEAARLELLGNLLRSSDRATRMVGQLLKLMRSDAACAAPQAMALEQLVQDRMAVLDALAAQRGVELELLFNEAAPVRICGERESLTSLIDNLVENAIKYSPPQGLVMVQVSKRGESAQLQVLDSGPGIAAEYREQVFQRFYRIADQPQSGSGLGLSIARSAVERHGGSISLHDGPSGGLRVTVYMPLC